MLPEHICYIICQSSSNVLCMQNAMQKKARLNLAKCSIPEAMQEKWKRHSKPSDDDTVNVEPYACHSKIHVPSKKPTIFSATTFHARNPFQSARYAARPVLQASSYLSHFNIRPCVTCMRSGPAGHIDPQLVRYGEPPRT